MNEQTSSDELTSQQEERLRVAMNTLIAYLLKNEELPPNDDLPTCLVQHTQEAIDTIPGREQAE